MKQTITYRVKGQPVFIGLEDSKRSWKLCVRSDNQIVHELSMPATFEDLLKYIRHSYPECPVKLMYEAGFHGFTLHDQLSSEGIYCEVLPPHILIEAKNNLVKTDKRDARRLALALQTHDYQHSCSVPDKERREDRQINRTGVQIHRKIVAIKNQIRRELEFHGLDEQFRSGVWYEKDYRELPGRLQQLSLSKSLSFSFSVLNETLAYLLEKRKILEKALLEIGKKEKYRRLMEIYTSVPGIGKLTAIRLILEWGDIRRFTTDKQFSSFTGMTPREYSTGETIRKGRITGQGNSLVRAWLIESAWTAIRIDPILNQKYREIFARTRSGKIAIVAVARKIAVRIRSCVLSDQLYTIGVVK